MKGWELYLLSTPCASGTAPRISTHLGQPPEWCPGSSYFHFVSEKPQSSEKFQKVEPGFEPQFDPHQSICSFHSLTCTTFLSRTQKGSLERAHLFSNWNLESFGGCVRFLSKEGRGKRPRRDYCNGPHEYLLLYTCKQRLLDTHQESVMSRYCELLMRKVVMVQAMGYRGVGLGPFVSICLQKSLLHRASMLLLSAELKNTGLEHAQALVSTEGDMPWAVEMSLDLCAQGRWP